MEISLKSHQVYCVLTCHTTFLIHAQELVCIRLESLNSDQIHRLLHAFVLWLHCWTNTLHRVIYYATATLHKASADAPSAAYSPPLAVHYSRTVNNPHYSIKANLWDSVWTWKQVHTFWCFRIVCNEVQIDSSPPAEVFTSAIPVQLLLKIRKIAETLIWINQQQHQQN